MPRIDRQIDKEGRDAEGATGSDRPNTTAVAQSPRADRVTNEGPHQSHEGPGMTTRSETDGSMARADRLARALHEGLPVTERRLDLAGVSTSLLEGGDGPPVVLLHGVGMFAEMWGGVIPHLVASHHRVVAPDLPGQGRSEMRAGIRLDAPAMVRWLGELIAQTCSEPPILVGASLGGSFAAHFGVEHSDRIRRIVLVASGSIGPFRPAAPGALLALARYMSRPSPPASTASSVMRCTTPSASPPRRLTGRLRGAPTTSTEPSSPASAGRTLSCCGGSGCGGSPLSGSGRSPCRSP